MESILNEVNKEIDRNVCQKNEEYVDYICLKLVDNKIIPRYYYLQGHPEYENNISRYGKVLNKKMYELGCFGTSEIISGNQNDLETFVKINIADEVQQEAVYKYFNSLIPLEKQVKELLWYLSNMPYFKKNTNEKASSLYKPLYYCGLVSKNDKVHKIKLYYQICDSYENEMTSSDKIRRNKFYINYLERYKELSNSRAFEVLKNYLRDPENKLISIGVDCLERGKHNIKYYIKSDKNLDNAAYLYEQGKLDSVEEKYILSNVKIIHKELKKQERIECKFIQIGSVNNEMIKMNLYYEFNRKFFKQYYCLKKEILLRDIGGINFLIDIKDKRYYDAKYLLTINEIGKAIFQYMKNNGVFSIEGIVYYIENLIIDFTPNMHEKIEKDVSDFVYDMINRGYVIEVNGGADHE